MASRGVGLDRNRRSAWHRMGMDLDKVCAFPGIPGDAVLSGIFGAFFRRQALRDEGRKPAHRASHAAPEFSKLVPAPLPLRLCGIPLRGKGERVNTAIAAEPTAHLTRRFALEVREGLCRTGQKTLPSKYLYDALGSALFDAIMALPEYGLTRAEERILRRHAEEIVSYVPRPAVVSELGSGNGRKTRWILSALCAREPLSYYPIEISHAALASCESELRDIEAVSIVGVEREYLDGLREVAGMRPRDSHLLVLFLGSTIGNFDRGADARFLSGVRRFLRAGDSLLLGTDMLKTEDRMIAAYDDPLGVTAAFNLNLLVRINRELGADFDPRQFAHE